MTAALGLLLSTAMAGLIAGDSPPRPSIVLILADDLGWSDVGMNGGDLVRTPHIDRLAREGVRFTQAYAPAPVCTPTRASILTGKAPARLRMTIWSEGALRPPRDRKLLEAESLPDLPLGEVTLAERLGGAGYLTALVGKWHLGDAAHAPETGGFDINIGGTHWGAPATYFWPYRGDGRFGGEFRYVPHLEFGKPGEYLTDRLTGEALRVIDGAGDRPFFLLLAHHAPHTPIEAKPEDVALFEKELRPGMHHRNPAYAAMVKSLDDGVGRVLACLDERGLASRTVVVFASDNGGYIGVAPGPGPVPITDNFPLRSGKGSCHEGGLRVPLAIRWPGVAVAGGVCPEPVVLTDLFPTLLAAAGIAPVDHPGGNPADGLDLAPLLRDPAGHLGREAIFFHYPHYYHAPKTAPAGAVRAGDWKLLEHFEDGRLELFDLRHDPGEGTDLSSRDPGRAAELRRRLAAWRESVGAAMPRPNPDHRSAPAETNRREIR